MELSQIIPWGRSYQEYRDMFLLTDKDRTRTILGCGDGPASFNAELSRAGGSVVSVDPIYRFSKEKIHQCIAEAYPQVMTQLSLNFSDYLWTKLGGVEELGRLRMQAMELFLSDYEMGKKTGRYLAASLPTLPFMDNSFDLALCSHYLFLYSAHIKSARHKASVLELCRVAREVHIYPLVDLDGKRSRHLAPVRALLEESGMEVMLAPVAHRFQKGATEMLVIRS
ncbi:MAG TPA: SAM-dependent methyltransferase [Desulfobulbus sp.]|nr:SAM-dependent methyltransferase [Desulfobulbus sp.]